MLDLLKARLRRRSEDEDREAAYRAQIDPGAQESADLMKNKIPTEVQGRATGG